MTDVDGAWVPLPLDDVADLLAGIGCPWWLAGGWAIDLHLGRTTRRHDDTDVSVLRRDQHRVQAQLAGWDLHCADPPGTLRPWSPGERLGVGVHDIWCRRTPSSPWSLQLVLDEADGADWVYRRDPRVRRPVATLHGPASTSRLPVLAPEVQLLHKSKAPRPKDEADLRAMAGSLSPEQRSWLDTALRTVSPGHPWLTRPGGDRSGRAR